MKESKEETLKELLKRLPKEIKCPQCGKVYDKKDFAYEGQLECRVCQRDDINYIMAPDDDQWDSVGYNQCLQEVRQIINKTMEDTLDAPFLDDNK